MRLPKNFPANVSLGCWHTLTSSGNLEDLETALLGDKVDGTAGRHGASQTLDAAVGLGEVWNGLLGPIGDDGHGVGRSDEGALAVDHVTVTVTVRSGTEGDVVSLNALNERVGISQVGVGVGTTKVREGNAVLDRGLRKAEGFNKDGASVRTGDTVQGVEKDLWLGLGLVEVLLDQVEVKDGLEESKVVLDRVDNGDLERTVGELANLGEVKLGLAQQSNRTYVREVNGLVAIDGLRDLVNPVGNLFRCRSAVVAVELDTEVIVWASGVVGSGEEDTTIRLF